MKGIRLTMLTARIRPNDLQIATWISPISTAPTIMLAAISAPKKITVLFRSERNKTDYAYRENQAERLADRDVDFANLDGAHDHAGGNQRAEEDHRTNRQRHDQNHGTRFQIALRRGHHGNHYQ